MKSGIYKLVWANGNFYFGQASDLVRRQREHLRQMRNGRHTNHRIQTAFDECGEPAFEIVERCPESELNLKEQLFVNDSMGNALCCNLAHNHCGASYVLRPTEETRKRIGEKSKEKVFTPEYREKLRIGAARRIAEGRVTRGYKLSDEARAKMSAAGKGRPKSAEHRAKIGAAHKGEKSYAYGKPISDAAKQKISASTSMEKNHKAKQVRNLLTGEVYPCAKLISVSTGINYSTLRAQLQRGTSKTYEYV